MKLRLTDSTLPFEKALRELGHVWDVSLGADGVPVFWEQSGNQLVVRKNEQGEVLIKGSRKVHFFRGLSLLSEHISEPEILIEETPAFRNLGASFDLSRNAVMTPKALFRMFCRAALMGYTEIYLYMEDTYQLEQYPFFGYLRGAFSKEELKCLDAQACELGLELIPCIQTLGHLERFLHWESSAELQDTPDVLLAGEEKTYCLIEAMLKNCRECFSTRKIHVGMDEAMNLGLGRYLKKNGFQSSFSIMLEHVKRVRELAHRFGFEPMMWSDMYFRCASPNNDYYEDHIEIPQWVLESAPEDVALVYWDYYHPQKEFYERYIRLHQQFRAPLCFAGGMWTWLGPAIDYDVFFRNAQPALYACLENGVQDIILTTWGDDGGETSPQAMLLGFQAYAEFCYRQTLDEEWLNRRLKACTKADGQALRMISGFNKTPQMSADSDLPNGAKFLLYQDPLLGIYDLDIESMGFAQQYRRLEQEFVKKRQEHDEWETLYLFYELLARVLKNKAELGIDLYRNYHAGKTQAFCMLADQALQASEDCTALLDAWRDLWEKECRPFGFEVLEGRIAWVISRLKSTARKVRQYGQGEISRIEELEPERTLVLRKEGTKCMHGVYFWKQIVSASKAF